MNWMLEGARVRGGGQRNLNTRPTECELQKWVMEREKNE